MPRWRWWIRVSTRTARRRRRRSPSRPASRYAGHIPRKNTNEMGRREAAHLLRRLGFHLRQFLNLILGHAGDQHLAVRVEFEGARLHRNVFAADAKEAADVDLQGRWLALLVHHDVIDRTDRVTLGILDL